MTSRRLLLAEILGLAVIVTNPVVAQDVDIYVSASGSGSAGGVPFADEDIVRCERSGGPGTCAWSVFFDGSDAGLSLGLDITAFHVVNEENILMALSGPVRNLVTGGNWDIMRFNRAADAPGALTLYFDGSDVGLDQAGESIDAIGFTATGGGRLVISTLGNFEVPGTGGGTLSGGDEDLIVFNGTTGPGGTAGDWELFFDGSAVGLNLPRENVWGTWIDSNTDEVYLTTRGEFSVPPLRGRANDIFICDPLNFDPIQGCASVVRFFIAGQEQFNAADIDGIFIVINNNPPVITSDGGGATASVSVDENTTAVTDVETTDTEDSEGAGLVYSLTGGADDAKFDLDASSGVLAFITAPDFETPTDFDGDNDYEVQVTVTDSGGLTDQQDITVTVTNVNEAPVITSDGGGATAAVSIDENTTAVTDVETIDPEDTEGAGLIYSLSGGADSALFSLDTSSGVLTFTNAPDFENQLDAGADNDYEVQVTVTDSGPGGTLTDLQDITVTVLDANDAPTDIALDSSDVDEGLASGTAVGSFTTTDQDTTDTHTYALVAGAGDTGNGSFGITGNQLETAAEFDYDDDSSFSIRVQTDDGTATFEEVFTITVNKVNTAPTDIMLSNSSVDENQAAGTVVGSLSSVDGNDSDTHAYTLVAGAGDTDNAQFSIVGDQIQTAAVLDYETTANCVTSVTTCSIRIQTDDGNSGTFEESFIISIGDINDPPTDISLDSSDVDEGLPVGTAVGNFTTTDQDTSDTHTYTLVAGAGDTGNASFSITGGQLETAAVFDADVQNSYSIRVRTSDSAATYEEAFTITINPDNSAPTDISLSNASVDENQAAGTTVGTLTTTDADATDMHSYTLVAGAGDTDNAQFSIVGDVLQTAAVLNHEAADNCVTSASTCSIRVKTDDGNSGVFEKTFIITINNVNEAPVAATDPYTGAIGNTRFALVSALSGSTPVPPTVELVGSVVTNDSDPDAMTTLTVTANSSIATSQGGTAAIDANGRFVYSPPAGFPGSGASADSFTYQVCDNGTGPLCSNGTVTIAGSGMVWYVDDSSPNNPGTGTADDPFRALSSASGPSLAGETIFIYAGTQTTGITLKNNQRLIGEGVALVVNTITLVNAGTRPVIAAASGTAVTLASDNNVSGINVTVAGSTQGIVGSSLGTATAINNASITTNTGTALSLSNGNATVTLDSVTSLGAGSNTVIALTNTGTGLITINGGTIDNKTVDAITLNNTDGKVTLKSMIIEDIGSTAGLFNTRSQHDAIHGQMVDGGLKLDGVTIRRVSDMCVNGALFTDGVSATTWTGLEIVNSTIEDCNRWHVADTGDTSDEGAVRIVGLTGTVNIDGSTIRRAGELMDLYTAPTGSLNMTVTNSTFHDAFKEFSPAVMGTVAIGKFCIDVTVEGDTDANITIGGAGTFPNNDFNNCGTASVRVSKDTVPGGNSAIDVIIDNNQFRVTDQTSANGIFGNTPQGGVALRAGPGGISSFDTIVSNNTFGIAVGPDDRIGSTGEEVANADGVGGNLALIFESGAAQARVNNNTFNGSLNAPWYNRADGNTSAAVVYENNSYRGRDDYCCDSGFTFTVPGIPYRTQVRNNGNLDITLRNDNFVYHDQFFFAQTETLELESPNIGGGGNLDVCLDNITAQDGIEFDEDAGAIRLYQGTVNNAATGPCGVEADGHAPSDCELEAADDGVRGGPAGHAQSGGPTPSLNPPHFDVDGGSIEITSIACTEPSGGIFSP